MIKKDNKATEAAMGSKLDYFIESAEWVAEHGDVLVREGCDALAGQFLVFCRVPGEDRWMKHGDPHAQVADAVEIAEQIPSCNEQGRLFAQSVKDLLGSKPSPGLVRTLNRLIDYEDHN